MSEQLSVGAAAYTGRDNERIEALWRAVHPRSVMRPHSAIIDMPALCATAARHIEYYRSVCGNVTVPDAVDRGEMEK